MLPRSGAPTCISMLIISILCVQDHISHDMCCCAPEPLSNSSFIIFNRSKKKYPPIAHFSWHIPASLTIHHPLTCDVVGIYGNTRPSFTSPVISDKQLISNGHSPHHPQQFGQHSKTPATSICPRYQRQTMI